jgi:hypothetical protein
VRTVPRLSSPGGVSFPHYQHGPLGQPDQLVMTVTKNACGLKCGFRGRAGGAVKWMWGWRPPARHLGV